MDFKSRAMIVVRISLAALAIAAIFFYAAEVFLLIFAGVLLAVFLSSSSSLFERKLGLSHTLSISLVICSLLLIFGGGGYLMAPSVAKQTDQLAQSLPKSVAKLKNQVESYGWGQTLIKKAESQKDLANTRGVLSRATGAVSSVLGWFANFVIILFIGIYGAIEPRTYRNGLLHLVPKKRRQRISEVLRDVHETLSWWLVGKFFGMAVIGVFTTIGLWLLDIPLALILGIIAALFTFIPNIGPILAAIPAILLGLTVSPEKAAYIALLYFVIQLAESYVLTPLVQRKTVSLPPGLTLGAQVLLGVIFGALGVALATPLTAALMVITQKLYVEDALGDRLTTNV